MSNYDEALFRQTIKKEHDKFGFVNTDTIENAFWKVCWDLDLAIQQQAPEKMDEAKAAFRLHFLPTFITMLEAEGFTVVQEEV